MRFTATSTTGKPSGPACRYSFTPASTEPMNCFGTAPPTIELVNANPAPGGLRPDLQHHVAILAVTAGLLLVAAALGDRLADGLTVADGWLVACDLDLGAVLQPLQGDAQVHLARLRAGWSLPWPGYVRP